MTAWPYHDEIEISIFLFLQLQSCLRGLGFNGYNVYGENPIGFRHFGGRGKELSLMNLCAEFSTWSPDIMGTSRYHCNINDRNRNRNAMSY